MILVGATCASGAVATSRSQIFGLARHHTTGIPLWVVIRYSLSPQDQRECAGRS